MFFNCDLEFCKKNGGPITHSFLENLPEDWKTCNPVIDTRVHMLMKGWYPAIPGFHHDDVPRTTPSGQPNYDNPEYHSEHLTGLVNADVAPTIFALGTQQFPEVNDGIIYRVWHPLVEHAIETGQMTAVSLKSGEYVQFDWQTFHAAQRAVSSGWRWFIRLSRNTDRQKNITNEIRRQVQVYLEFPADGW